MSDFTALRTFLLKTKVTIFFSDFVNHIENRKEWLFYISGKSCMASTLVWIWKPLKNFFGTLKVHFSTISFCFLFLHHFRKTHQSTTQYSGIGASQDLWCIFPTPLFRSSNDLCTRKFYGNQKDLWGAEGCASIHSNLLINPSPVLWHLSIHSVQSILKMQSLIDDRSWRRILTAAQPLPQLTTPASWCW